ncbi:UNVERIFIED_CONTAM: VanZ family protein [Microbacterium sp. SLM126]
MTDISTTRGRGIRLLLAGAFAAIVTLLTLAPPSIAAPLRGLFVRSLVEVGHPLLIALPFGDIDDALNLLLFVPLGATLALLLPRRLWVVAILAAFALSVAVEFAQRSIPGRVPDGDDVLWNTVGATVGVLAVAIPRLVAAVARRQRGSVTRT